MAENVGKFTWNKAKERAALLLAEDELTDVEIAAEVGVSDRQLLRWKHDAEFAVRIKQHVDALGQVALRNAVARRNRRVKALDERWQALQRVLTERGADPAMADVPGGTTGLLVRTLKGVGSGERFEIVEEYEVDTGLLRELREHEKQAAIELGQWAEKRELSGPGGGPIPFDYDRLYARPDVPDPVEERIAAAGQPPASEGSHV